MLLADDEHTIDPTRILELLKLLTFPVDVGGGRSFKVGVVVPIEVYDNILSLLKLLSGPAQGEA